jgi:hypothetical protein
MLPQPLLDVNVATYGHRGMLGIDTDIYNNDSLSGDKISNERDQISEITSSNNTENKYIFLFFTAAQKEDGEDIAHGKQPLGNVVYRYRYEFKNNELINPKLLLNLPSSPEAIRNGGRKILFNSNDKNLYVTIGGVGVDTHETKTQNFKNGKNQMEQVAYLLLTRMEDLQ